MTSSFNEAPFVFISYAHKNSKLIEPIITAMESLGIRVWYDKGIKAGSEWAKELQYRIRECSIFVPFLSPEYEDSTNCFTEISYASKLKKNILSVKMQQTPLARGLSLMLSNRQMVDRTNPAKYPNDAAFLHAFLTAEILNPCRSKESISAKELSSVIMNCAIALSCVDEPHRQKNVDTGIIENASVIGSFSKSDARWKENNSESTVNAYIYPYIHFRCTLKESYKLSTNKSIKVKILDPNGSPVLEKEQMIEIPADTKNITFPINLRENSIKKGEYVAFILIDLVNVFRLVFTINGYKNYSPSAPSEETEEKASHFGIFILSMIQSVFFTILTFFFKTVPINQYHLFNMKLVIFCILVWLVISEIIRRWSVKHLKVNPLLSFIFVYIFGIFYSIFLFFNAFKHSKTLAKYR